MGGIECAQNQMDGINTTRKNTYHRLFANQTLSFYFAVLAFLHFVHHANRACAETQTRSRSTYLLAKTPPIVMYGACFTHLGPHIHLNVKYLFFKGAVYKVPGMDFYLELHVFGAVPVRKKDGILD